VGGLTTTALTARQQDTTWHVRLHRPEADNAIDAAMVAELTDVLGKASASSATVVVVEGLPEVFCVGADFGVISDAARRGESTAFDPELMFELFHRLAFSEVFTVAHVRGRANAGGVGIAASCDVVLAEERATFGLSELLFGLIPAVVMPFLIRRIGFQRAHYLAGTTQTVNATQAAEWGLVDAVGPDSATLVRTHLRRLELLSKRAVARYKAYAAELRPITAPDKELALRTNREVFTDPANIDAIRRYAEKGLLPWETVTDHSGPMT
jgi:enoyl-CoA hydratase/carnithine racemase